MLCPRKYFLFLKNKNADCDVLANMAYNEGRIQALAGCQPDTARIHTSGEENSRRKLSRIGVGSVSSTLRCMIACINGGGTLENP